MIHEALKETGIDLSKCYIIPVPNDEDNARWLAYLRSMLPPFDVLYSGNDFVKYLARSQDPGIAIEDPVFAEKEKYNGTNIRLLMQDGKPWEHLVPPAVVNVIGQVGGIMRINILAHSDSNPQRW
jgi:nicotinamide-nucleotide adenylyltransferase